MSQHRSESKAGVSSKSRSPGLMIERTQTVSSPSLKARPRLPPALRVTAERGIEAFEAGLGPELACLVVIPERRRSLRQLEPLRFCACVDVHVRLQRARLVERSDAHVAYVGFMSVVAPDRGLTTGAAVDFV